MTTDFRELCRELVRAMDSYPVRPMAHRQLCDHVRQVLAETAPAANTSTTTNTHGNRLPDRY